MLQVAINSALPLDVVVCIAENSLQPDLLSLASLDSNCYQALLPILYRSVHIRRIPSFTVFSETMIKRHSLLGSYPRTININIVDLWQIYSDEKYTGNSLRAVLELLSNLTDLTIVMPDVMLGSVFESEDCPYPFTLKRFHMRPTRQNRIDRFLCHQSQLEVLELAYDMDSAPFRPFRRDLEALGRRILPGFLPRLRQVMAPQQLLPYFVPNRPVTAIDTGSLPLDARSLASLSEVLRRVTTPIRRLKVGLIVPHNDDPNPILAHILSTMSHSREALEELTIVLHLRHRQAALLWLTLQGPVSRSFVDMVILRFQLSQYSALEYFWIEQKDVETPSDAALENRLSHMRAWKQMCPTLKHISLFGFELHLEGRTSW